MLDPNQGTAPGECPAPVHPAPEQPKPDLVLSCESLPTKFRPSLGTVLVTGASGYIGGRLVEELLHRGPGYQVRAMVRKDAHHYESRWPNAEIVEADALNPEDMRRVLQGVDTAYYLIHSLALGPAGFEEADRQAAHNFQKAAEEAGIKRIIYLGGLEDREKNPSKHLASRRKVEDILGDGKTPVTSLRAGVIVGSGSASYEIIKGLIEKLPVIPVPPLARHECQPISIRDVLKYLVGVLEIPAATRGRHFDIGGHNVLTYEQMLRTMAARLGKRVAFIPLPAFFTNIPMLSYCASLFTPVPRSIIACLLEGLKSSPVCRNNAIRDIISFPPLPYGDAVDAAIAREARGQVPTRWSDAYYPGDEYATKLAELGKEPRFKVRYSLITSKSAEKLFAAIKRIGGREGWYSYNWMWRLRGDIDRVLLGVGTLRGRRNDQRLRINDPIDFWRVEDLQESEGAKRLLLRAEMRLPGKAWLDFNIQSRCGQQKLEMTAYFEPHGILGSIYWYAVIPFHELIFNKLIRSIEERG